MECRKSLLQIHTLLRAIELRPAGSQTSSATLCAGVGPILSRFDTSLLDNVIGKSLEDRNLNNFILLLSSLTYVHTKPLEF